MVVVTIKQSNISEATLSSLVAGYHYVVINLLKCVWNDIFRGRSTNARVSFIRDTTFAVDERGRGEGCFAAGTGRAACTARAQSPLAHAVPCCLPARPSASRAAPGLHQCQGNTSTIIPLEPSLNLYANMYKITYTRFKVFFCTNYTFL